MTVEFEIKAINGDNEVQINQLVKLFERVYGDTFPIKSVYDAQFWKTHIGSRFVSLGAFREGQLIAHLAACPDNDNPRHIQMCFPICSPAHCHLVASLGSSAWKFFQRQAVRQDWEMIYYFVLGNVPDMQLLADRVFCSSEVAFCPEYFPATNLRPRGVRESQLFASGERSHIAITQRVLRPQGKSKSLHVPDRHREMVQHLYHPLKLKREFLSSSQVVEFTFPADAEGFERNYFRETGVEHIFVQPGLASSNTPQSTFSRPGVDTCYMFVNMEDPTCPEFCDRIEAAGYRFCGVLPLVKNRDSIIFYRGKGLSIGKEEMFFSPRSRMLASYSEHQDVSVIRSYLSGLANEAGVSYE
jgi:hypothetical protein